MATPTTTSISVSESQHVMTDSGIVSSSTTSLTRLVSSYSTSGSSVIMPKVRMPNVSESVMNNCTTVSNTNIGSNSNSMHDSGISCSTDLMMRLSLSSGSSAETSPRSGQTQNCKSFSREKKINH